MNAGVIAACAAATIAATTAQRETQNAPVEVLTEHPVAAEIFSYCAIILMALLLVCFINFLMEHPVIGSMILILIMIMIICVLCCI